MRRSSEGGLKVTPTPVPSGIEEAGLQIQKFLRTLQIAMGSHNELFDQIRCQCRAAVRNNFH